MRAAHQPVDEPLDREEEPMTPDAFEVMQRAHAASNHPPAVDITTDLEPRAASSTSAAAICRSLCDELLNEGSLLRTLVDAETKPTAATYWQQIATAAWCGKSWKAAAVAYQVTRRNAYAWVRQ
jgi:hypothetical protein